VVSEEVPGAPLAGFGPGSRIAGYILEEQAGAGGMAVVFRAHDERLDRQVALKILAPAYAADEAFRQRFIRESRAAAAVDDPHIIPVFEAGEANGVLFIAMRYVRGGDLRSLLTQSGPLPPGRVAEIIAQVSSALDAAHDRGLVHRDVKPANMLLDSGGRSGRPDHVYLSDFGLSKGALAASGLTRVGQFLGTLDYISPEQIEGKLIDGRADEYALACAAYELLTGAPPFRRDEAMAVMYAQLSQPPPTATSRRPDLPPAVDGVFARALAKAPGDRYPACRDFSDALTAACGIRSSDSSESTIPPTSRLATQIAAWRLAGKLPAAGAGSAAGADSQGLAAMSGGPATKIAQQRPERTTSESTEVHSLGDGGPPDGAAGREPPWWRSRGALVGTLVVLLALGGGGAYLALTPPAKSVAQQVAFLAPPACSTTAAAGKTLKVAASTLNLTYGHPFGLQVASNGGYVFASTPTTLSVLVMNPNHTVARQYPYYVTSPGESAKGVAMTSDAKYVAVAVGNGINVQSVPAAEQGASTANVANLTVPNVLPRTDAAQVALSPGDQYAFVTLPNANKLAVFDLHKALALGQSAPGVLVGTVTLGLQPTGLAVSPDGQWLYVTSIAKTPASGPSEGLVSVLSMSKLETSPASAVVSQATAGCSPVRVVASPDGKMVWVTARLSNELLGFSTARLRSDPKQALIVKVQVGLTPTGEILVDGGRKMVVADTDLTNGPPTAHNLAVVDLTAALTHKPALIGYIPSGQLPRELTVQANGQYLYVADNGSAQIQVVNLSTVP
jgi:serine/threonine protein kinase/DNA-binding beta-propeller fold protein YncE